MQAESLWKSHACSNSRDVEDPGNQQGSLLGLQQKAEPRQPWYRHGRTILELLLVIALLLMVAAATGLLPWPNSHLAVPQQQQPQQQQQTEQQAAPLSPECLHALGGGRVGPGGGFPHEAPHGCVRQHASYAAPGGPYWLEVQQVADDMLRALNLTGERGRGDGAAAAAAHAEAPASRRRQLLIFDIDETTLSNLEQLRAEEEAADAAASAPPAAAGATGGGGGGGGAGGAPANGSSSGTGSGSGATSGAPLLTWDEWVASARAPPLEAVRDVYWAAYASGYSVAFLTGRGEAGYAPTAANLAAAGYGSACVEGAPQQSAAGVIVGAAGGGSAPATLAAGAAPGTPGAALPPGYCYVALLMRAVGDERLASVYKPWARRQLVAAGYELLATVGDQFSDLNGDNAVPFAFKLPNVWYYIL